MTTSCYLADGGRETLRSVSRARHGERGVWQRRYWEHTIRSEQRFIDLCDYIHYNPVKHGLVNCPHVWPWSSFAKFVRNQLYEHNWNCACKRVGVSVDFSDVAALTGE